MIERVKATLIDLLPAGRLGWGVADQAVSSLTNFLVGIVVARTVSSAEFGAFAIAFSTYLIALNVSRGMSTDALLVRFSAVDDQAWRRAVAASTGTAILIGLLCGLVCLGAAMIIDPSGPALIALGLTLPGLLLQDSWRFAFLAAERASQAFTNDLVWGTTLAVLLVAVIVSGHTSQFTFTLAWGLSATVAALFGIGQAQLRPAVSQAPIWLRRQRDLWTRYTMENLVVVGGSELKFYGLGAIAGLAAVGSLRAAELLFGPVFVLTMGIGLIAVPEAVKTLRKSPVSLRHFCIVVSVIGAAAAASWGTAVDLLVSDSLGRQILGASWPAAERLIVPTAVAVAGIASHIGAYTGLRALAAATRSLLSQAFMLLAYLAGTLIGATLDGVLGAAWGIAVASLSGATFFWVQFTFAVRAYDDESFTVVAAYDSGAPRWGD